MFRNVHDRHNVQEGAWPLDDSDSSETEAIDLVALNKSFDLRSKKAKRAGPLWRCIEDKKVGAQFWYNPKTNEKSYLPPELQNVGSVLEELNVHAGGGGRERQDSLLETWTCARCTLQNSIQQPICAVCGAIPPLEPSPKKLKKSKNNGGVRRSVRIDPNDIPPPPPPPPPPDLEAHKAPSIRVISAEPSSPQILDSEGLLSTDQFVANLNVGLPGAGRAKDFSVNSNITLDGVPADLPDVDFDDESDVFRSKKKSSQASSRQAASRKHRQKLESFPEQALPEEKSQPLTLAPLASQEPPADDTGKRQPRTQHISTSELRSAPASRKKDSGELSIDDPPADADSKSLAIGTSRSMPSFDHNLSVESGNRKKRRRKRSVGLPPANRKPSRTHAQSVNLQRAPVNPAGLPSPHRKTRNPKPGSPHRKRSPIRTPEGSPRGSPRKTKPDYFTGLREETPSDDEKKDDVFPSLLKGVQSLPAKLHEPELSSIYFEDDDSPAQRGLVHTYTDPKERDRSSSTMTSRQLTYKKGEHVLVELTANNFAPGVIVDVVNETYVEVIGVYSQENFKKKIGWKALGKKMKSVPNLVHGNSFLNDEQVADRLRDFRSQNKVCADCTGHPEWAELKHGVIICSKCSGVHRRLGTDVSRIKSLTLDSWTLKMYRLLKGNDTVNEFLEFHVPNTYLKPHKDSEDALRDKYIESKYKLKLFARAESPSEIQAPPLPPVYDRPKVEAKCDNTAVDVKDILAMEKKRRQSAKSHTAVELLKRKAMVQNNGFLQIMCFEARDLPGNSMAKIRKAADPFCVFCNGDFEKGRTKTCKDTKNPKWDAMIVINVQEKLPVQVLVYNANTYTKDELLCFGTFDVSILEPDKEKQYDLHMEMAPKFKAKYEKKKKKKDPMVFFRVTYNKLATS